MKASDTVYGDSTQIELGILGQSLLYQECLEKYAFRLVPSDFVDPVRASIWQTVQDLVESTGGVEAVALLDRVQFNLTGEKDYVAACRVICDCVGFVSGPANTDYYLDTILRRSRVRRIKSAALELARIQTEDPRVLTQHAENAIQDASLEDAARPEPIYEVMADRFKFYEQVLSGKTKVKRTPTGLHALNEKTGGGFSVGDQWILAARPSMGKTALSLLSAIAAAESGASVLYFSIEMNKESIADRIFGMNARTPARNLANGIIGEDQWPGLLKAINRLEGRTFEIVSRGGITIGEIISIARRSRIRHPLDLIVVDYIGNVRPFRGRKYGSREQEIADVSRELKALAMELGCATLVLAQLNREIEKRSDAVPKMSDLRESGQIEADADVIMFLHRQYVVDPQNADPKEAVLHIAKQRNGDIGTINIAFDGPSMLFGNAMPGRI